MGDERSTTTTKRLYTLEVFSIWIYQMEAKVVSKGIHIVSLLAEQPIPLLIPFNHNHLVCPQHTQLCWKTWVEEKNPTTVITLAKAKPHAENHHRL